MLRDLANTCGIIILTDSDSAGFLIRNHIRSFIPEGRVLNAYIPDVYGKEKRKSTPGKEGKLGVEGMKREVILTALREAGATIGNEEPAAENHISISDLFQAGLTGHPDSKEKRKVLLHAMSLPEHLSTKVFAEILSKRMNKKELSELMVNLKIY